MAIRQTRALLLAEIKRHRALARIYENSALYLAERHRRLAAVLEQAIINIEEVERDEDSRDHQSEGRRGEDHDRHPHGGYPGR